ncbi:MAG: hypothetical protein JSS75_07325 [Bacteroidetes bacterium]|nr:hypothetical protein [Bacteroidota bacterium]
MTITAISLPETISAPFTEFSVDVPINANALTFEICGNRPVLYAMHGSTDRRESRTFILAKDSLPDTCVQHIGSARYSHGVMMHLFERVAA